MFTRRCKSPRTQRRHRTTTCHATTQSPRCDTQRQLIFGPPRQSISCKAALSRCGDSRALALQARRRRCPPSSRRCPAMFFGAPSAAKGTRYEEGALALENIILATDSYKVGRESARPPRFTTAPWAQSLGGRGARARAVLLWRTPPGSRLLTPVCLRAGEPLPPVPTWHGVRLLLF